MSTARVRPMPADELAQWRAARADDGVPLPEQGEDPQDPVTVEVDGVTVGAALLEYVEDGGLRCYVRVLQTTVPPEAGSAWAAVLDALEARARGRGATILAAAVPPPLAGVFGAAGFRATMTTVGKRLTTSPFAPELQQDRRVAVRSMTADERRRFAEEGLDVMVPGMERAGVVERASPRLADLETQLARIGQDPPPDDELLMTAVVGDLPVGRFWATFIRREDGALDLFGNLVEIFPEHRGQGLTKSLLGAIRRHLHELGVRDLHLRVLGHDARAGKTFRTAGYGVADVHLRKELR